MNHHQLNYESCLGDHLATGRFYDLHDLTSDLRMYLRCGWLWIMNQLLTYLVV